MIVFPVKALTKIFSRENRSMSNYAKYFCLNVTKKGVHMQDYCLTFEPCKMAADQMRTMRTHAQSLIGWESNLVVVPDIFLVPFSNLIFAFLNIMLLQLVTPDHKLPLISFPQLSSHLLKRNTTEYKPNPDVRPHTHPHPNFFFPRESHNYFLNL